MRDEHPHQPKQHRRHEYPLQERHTADFDDRDNGHEFGVVPVSLNTDIHNFTANGVTKSEESKQKSVCQNIGTISVAATIEQRDHPVSG